jgi:hypothetical protein
VPRECPVPGCSYAARPNVSDEKKVQNCLFDHIRRARTKEANLKLSSRPHQEYTGYSAIGYAPRALQVELRRLDAEQRAKRKKCLRNESQQLRRAASKHTAIAAATEAGDVCHGYAPDMEKD